MGPRRRGFRSRLRRTPRPARDRRRGDTMGRDSNARRAAATPQGRARRRLRRLRAACSPPRSRAVQLESGRAAVALGDPPPPETYEKGSPCPKGTVKDGIVGRTPARRAIWRLPGRYPKAVSLAPDDATILLEAEISQGPGRKGRPPPLSPSRSAAPGRSGKARWPPSRQRGCAPLSCLPCQQGGGQPRVVEGGRLGL